MAAKRIKLESRREDEKADDEKTDDEKTELEESSEEECPPPQNWDYSVTTIGPPPAWWFRSNHGPAVWITTGTGKAEGKPEDDKGYEGEAKGPEVCAPTCQ